MVSTPPSSAHVNDEKKRKHTLEKAKATHLSRQLQVRLQYAKLKIHYGWQKQNLNEVENLYFHQAQARIPKPYHPTPSSTAQKQKSPQKPPPTPTPSFRIVTPAKEEAHEKSVMDITPDTPIPPVSASPPPAPPSQASTSKIPAERPIDPKPLPLPAELASIIAMNTLTNLAPSAPIISRSSSLSGPAFSPSHPMPVAMQVPTYTWSRPAYASSIAPGQGPSPSLSRRPSLMSPKLQGTQPTTSVGATKRSSTSTSALATAAADPYGFNTPTSSLTYDSFWAATSSSRSYGSRLSATPSLSSGTVDTPRSTTVASGNT